MTAERRGVRPLGVRGADAGEPGGLGCLTHGGGDVGHQICVEHRRDDVLLPDFKVDAIVAYMQSDKLASEAK